MIYKKIFFIGFFSSSTNFLKIDFGRIFGGKLLGCKPKNHRKSLKMLEKSSIFNLLEPVRRLNVLVWRHMYTSTGARSMLNRKCSSIPDRRKKMNEKYFFIMEKNYFENFDLKIFQKYFFEKSKNQNLKIFKFEIQNLQSWKF